MDVISTVLPIIAIAFLLGYPLAWMMNTLGAPRGDTPKFRFTIRELLLVVLILSLSLGWWRDHREQEWRLTRLYFATSRELGVYGRCIRITPESLQFGDGVEWDKPVQLSEVMAFEGISESRTWRDVWRQQSNK
jgi:hypothetical protein